MAQPTPNNSTATPSGSRKSFREMQFAVREEAILDATNRLLSTKGFEGTAMDDIATDVGIAKGSLYKHFESKESLASTVIIRLIQRAQKAMDERPAGETAIQRLRELLYWALRERIAGRVPRLPCSSPSLREHLAGNAEHLGQLVSFAERIAGLIQEARADGKIEESLHEVFIIHQFYSRACDPTLEFLRISSELSDEEILRQLVTSTMQGLSPQSDATRQLQAGEHDAEHQNGQHVAPERQ